MESTARQPVDLASSRDLTIPALVLAVLSVPGSLFTWDTVPGEGWVWGFPPALAAVVLGVLALRASSAGRGRAIAAVIIGGAMLAMMLIWTAVGAG